MGRAEQGASGPFAELPGVLRTGIRQFMLLPVTPDVFDRVEFGGVRRQVLDHDAAFLGGDEILDQGAAMSGQPIPDDHHGTAQVPPGVFEKLHRVRGAEGVGRHPEVEVPPGGAGHDRQRLPIEGELQNWRLPSSRQGPDAMRSLTQSAFVDANNRASLGLGFRLMVGQVRFFQTRMACWSLSRARPTGRWRLQPRATKIFQTWLGWYRVPNSLWIRWATRSEVQRLVSYPSCWGPFLGKSSKRAASAKLRWRSRLARHLGVVESLREQIGGPEPPVLQSIEITFRTFRKADPDGTPEGREKYRCMERMSIDVNRARQLISLHHSISSKQCGC